MTKKVKLIILLFGFLGVFMAANFVLAADFGVNEVNNGLAGSLTSTDPRVLIGRIIQIALSFLGAIAIVIIMYAGFLWMSSDGDEEKISQAQKILKNAVIGLVIILASWGITTFILSRLSAAIGGGGSEPQASTGGGFSDPGVSSIGSCAVESTYPADKQQDVPRNTSIMITFREELKLNSVCGNGPGNTTACTCNNTDCNKVNPEAIRLYKVDPGDTYNSRPELNGNITNILVTIPSGNKTLVLTPLDYLGSPDGNTPYTIKFTKQIKKLDDSSMFRNCYVDYASWDFTVSNVLDLTPPIILSAGMFPAPDNQKDIYQEVTPAVSAIGSLTVNGCPRVYSAARVNSVSPTGATVTLNYHGSISSFRATVPSGAPNKIQLFDSNNNLLGIADFNQSGTATIGDYLTFQAANHPEGSLWTINITPEQLADTLTVNNIIYNFSVTGENNNIRVPVACDNNVQAQNITAKLSGHPDLEVNSVNNKVNLVAKVAGQRGNDIAITTTNSTALTIQPFTGGQDRSELNQAQDRKDRPMNSIIQVNFSEALNPITVSGLASEVARYVKVINANASSSLAGVACNGNSQCRSYKCETGVCVGDYLGGKFMVGSDYKTVEFISDRECGVNGCGEKIYCLPADSHLAVELMAANLKNCGTDSDCLAVNPFRTCASTPLGSKVCQNADGKNYPAADLSRLDGIIDAANNSFDGDRSTFSDGPQSFYNANAAAAENINKKDNYRWSFFVSNKIMSDSPKVTSALPVQGQTGSQVTLAQPVLINFNTLMMNSTLKSGSVALNNGTSTFEHKLINLSSSAPTPLGYWIAAENKDNPPLDGEPDLTAVAIVHSPFLESVAYKSQVGSGVKDIYQNCYKPSAGPNCTATTESPSCCFGTPTNVLGTDGNCQ